MMKNYVRKRIIRKESVKQPIRLNEKKIHGIFFQIAFELSSHRDHKNEKRFLEPGVFCMLT